LDKDLTPEEIQEKVKEKIDLDLHPFADLPKDRIEQALNYLEEYAKEN
jgi:hypothetical protein